MQYPTTRTRLRPHRRVRLLVALAIALSALLAACSDDTVSLPGDGGGTAPPEEGAPPEETAPPETAPPETAPPETAPPETAPPETAPPESPESGDDEMSDEDWIVLGLLGLAVLLIVIAATSVASRHSEAKQTAKASLDQRLRQVNGAGQWIHDQGSIEILRLTDPDQLRASWGTTRAQMVDFEARVAAVTSGISDPATVAALGEVSRSAAGLRGALDSSVSLRLDPDAAAKTELTESATQTVLERRRELETALRRLTPAPA